jgi:hypothetical protein
MEVRLGTGIIENLVIMYHYELLPYAIGLSQNSESSFLSGKFNSLIRAFTFLFRLPGSCLFSGLSHCAMCGLRSMVAKFQNAEPATFPPNLPVSFRCPKSDHEFVHCVWGIG